MKHLIARLAVYGLSFISLSSAVHAEMVKTGKTWWYSGYYHAAHFPPVTSSSDWVQPIVGLTIGEVEYQENRLWYPCYAVGKDKVAILEKPLCFLLEENGKIWMRPGDEYIGERPYRPEINMLKIFLGFWFEEGFPFREFAWIPEEEPSSYLIYDFNMGEGEAYQWPWSGMFGGVDKWGESERIWIDENLEKGFFIKDIREETNDGNTRKRIEIIQKSSHSPIDYYSTMTGTIVEGIGIVRGDFESYVWCVNGIPQILSEPGERYNITYGFWICPACVTYVDSPGIGYPTGPYLRSVTEADGTCIYGDPDFEKKLAQIESVSASRPQNGQLYDLQGRPLSEPVRGQLYVRDGKLQFAK